MGDNMLSFARPELLLLLPLVVLFGWWWHRRKRLAFRFSDLRLFAGLPRGRARWLPWTRTLLRCGILSVMILAAAGPRFPDEKTRLPVQGIAIALVFDVSGSMAAVDFTWQPGEPALSRLEAARRAFRLFVEGGDTPDGMHFPGRPTDAIALIPFAAWPETVCPLTLNRSVLLTILDSQQPRSGIDAGTNVGDAIAEGLIRLEAAGNRKKVMILFSDGEHNISRDGPLAPLKPRQAAQLAANLQVPIYAIDSGGVPRSPEQQQQREAGKQVLRDIAALTRGRSFSANNGKELLDVCQQIDTLERQPRESQQYRRYHELGPMLGLVAIALLVLLQGAEMSLLRIRP